MCAALCGAKRAGDKASLLASLSRGTLRAATDLAGGDPAARQTFRGLTGRDPSPPEDVQELPDGRVITYREFSSSRTPAFHIDEPALGRYETIHFSN
jgi:hypothetical protein